MSKNSNISVDLRELEILRNPASPHYSMPKFSGKDQAILDIGCGIGQTFVASRLENGRLLVGLDIDLDSLLCGHSQFRYINYVSGTAECLPFRSDSFDFVISRLSLPYTNIRKSLMEIRRVVKQGKGVWFELHPFPMTLKDLRDSAFNFKIKAVIYQLYVVANGVLFHVLGKQFPSLLRYRSETFQTTSGITRALKRAGLTNIAVQSGTHFIVTAQKRS